MPSVKLSEPSFLLKLFRDGVSIPGARCPPSGLETQSWQWWSLISHLVCRRDLDSVYAPIWDAQAPPFGEVLDRSGISR